MAGGRLCLAGHPEKGGRGLAPVVADSVICWYAFVEGVWTAAVGERRCFTLLCLLVLLVGVVLHGSGGGHGDHELAMMAANPGCSIV